MKDSMKKCVPVVHFKIYYLLLLPGIFIVFVIRLLRPLVKVRLGELGMDRIGSLYYVLWYLSEKSEGKHKHCFDIFYINPNIDFVANRFWYDLIDRKLAFFPYRRLAWVVLKLNRWFPGYVQHEIRYHIPPTADTLRCVFASDLPLFEFTDNEVKEGRRALKELGLKEDKPLVCLHTRDSAYLNQVQFDVNWRYHDYRDTSIANYVKAIECYLAKNDAYAVRMGAVVSEPVVTDDSRIIDYANSGKRSDFLDVYLSAHCRLFLSSDTGMTILPEAFKRPLIYVNWVRICRLSLFYSFAIVIFKKWYSIKEKRFFSVEEMLTASAKSYTIDKHALGIEFVDNTAEEILDAVVEMEEILSGAWCTTPEDDELQDKFWMLYGKEKMRSPKFRIGKKFLRENRGLLIMRESK